MKKSFQIWREVTIPAKEDGLDGEITITEQLKENFAKATGFFVVPFASAQRDLTGLTAFLKIAQNEILPKGTDLGLVAFNGNVSLKDTIYDFTNDGIPARSSDFELTLSNSNSSPAKINVYVVLENE